MLSAINASIIQQQQGQSQQELTSEQLKERAIKEYQELIKYYGRYDGFWLSMQDSEGNWLSKPKLFRYHKITVQDYNKSKEMIRNWKGHVEPFPLEANEVVEEEEQTIDEMIEEHMQIVNKTVEYYKFLSSCYLHMSTEEFERCDWNKLQFIINTCNYRTEHSLVIYSDALFEFFNLENARGEPMTTHLKPRDIELLNMYQLWITEPKLPPWKLNGGTIYEEDISMFLKLEEYRMIGEKRKQGKQEARERAKSGEGGTVRDADGSLHKHRTTYRNR